MDNFALRCDVTRESDVRQAIRTVDQRCGRLDYLAGRPVYRRTRYLVARRGDACAVAEVSKESERPLFSPVTGLTMIAREFRAWEAGRAAGGRGSAVALGGS